MDIYNPKMLQKVCFYILNSQEQKPIRKLSKLKSVLDFEII